MLTFFRRIQSGLQRLEETTLGLAIATMAMLTVLNVFCRTLLGFSLAFAEEVSRFCVIIVCFVGLSYAAGLGRHIRMTALIDVLPRGTRKKLLIGVQLTTALLMLVLARFAWSYVVTAYELGGVSSTLQVPFFVVYALAPAGLVLAAVQYALAAMGNVLGEANYIAFNVAEEDEVASPGEPQS